MSYQWKCSECGLICNTEQMLVAQHPFDPKDQVLGCPRCKEINTLVRCCYEPGCTRPATCGTPIPPDDYRHTCCDHMPDRGNEQ